MIRPAELKTGDIIYFDEEITKDKRGDWYLHGIVGSMCGYYSHTSEKCRFRVKDINHDEDTIRLRPSSAVYYPCLGIIGKQIYEEDYDKDMVTKCASVVKSKKSGKKDSVTASEQCLSELADMYSRYAKEKEKYVNECASMLFNNEHHVLKDAVAIVNDVLEEACKKGNISEDILLTIAYRCTKKFLEDKSRYEQGLDRKQ